MSFDENLEEYNNKDGDNNTLTVSLNDISEDEEEIEAAGEKELDLKKLFDGANKGDFFLNDREGIKDPLSFNSIKLGIASPDAIKKWSHGEVKKPETINYRTLKPERDGLFCARIFGPIKDYECNCGKYKRMKHRGIVCEKCGVEVISSKVRRERLGHIELASPVAHIWFFKSLPSRIGSILDMTLKDIERILYFEAYVVLEPGDASKIGLKYKDLISEENYQKIQKEGYSFKAGIGAEALKELLKGIDLESLSKSLKEEIAGLPNGIKKKKLAKQLKLIEAFRTSGNKPEWMILDVIPVIPPDLRPLVPLEGGRFASSDLNDLYRRVINRNNRLKKLMELSAPEIIIKNEKRMLQEAVDALFDNGRRGRVIMGSNRRPLKSLSDMLKGKTGRFRLNLLGKRVDYSGRSVIVVGPELKLHQCGLPKKMAIELFKPFIFNKLLQKGVTDTLKTTKKLVDKEAPEVFDVLEEVIKEHPVMLNRAPTLHRLGIQAFEPILVEGKAIHLHPLVCAAFNADFDGDQMAVHVPLSIEAQVEARVLMMATNNILSPASGKPIIVPSQDIVLGLYYMTREMPYVKGEDKIFSDPDEVKFAYDNGHVSLHARIKVRINNKIETTTVGRVILYEIIPEEIAFDLINTVMSKKEITNLIDYAFRVCGPKKTVILADKLKSVGYEYSTKSGISICISDMEVPTEKNKIIKVATKTVEEIENSYKEGLITNGERYNKVVDTWANATDEIGGVMMNKLGTQEYSDINKKKKMHGKSFNSIFIMADSGSRGSETQIRQLAGMRGLMAKPSGEIIETPITANFREGLTVLQYFISTHGARKGLADTALKTANSGYLTRRLVDVSQDNIITEQDCGTMDGIVVSTLVESGETIEPIEERILGRVALEDIIDPFSSELIIKANEEIQESHSSKIGNAHIESVKIRSVLTCKAKTGVCVKCYGRDLARGHLVNIGEAIGVMAAQSIGEPGTQLTMRTFHVGGTASRRTEQTSIENKYDGIVKFQNLNVIKNRDKEYVVMNKNGSIIIVDDLERELEKIQLTYGSKIKVEPDSAVKKNTLLADWDSYINPIISDISGKIKYDDIRENETMQEQVDETTGLSRKVIIESRDQTLRPKIVIKSAHQEKSYLMPIGAHLSVQEGDEVFAGDIIARIPRETTKTKDITGGLPKVVELFEARKPKEWAVITEISGKVSFGRDFKGKRRVIITPPHGEPREYLIPKGKLVSVHEGDYVNAGEPLMDGSPNPHDILKVLGEKELAKFLVDEIQEVYRLQGVKINDKHIEVIVKQMLKNVRIKNSGNSRFLEDEVIDKNVFDAENERIIGEGGIPAIAEPELMGITKASLSTESFISAASFQETTKVLTEAAIHCKIDNLKGLKENVIMGRLIPAGTGFEKYSYLDVDEI
ncbi:MAG: DNA-directed RNA polymerase subunit beta' [Patescibacteria group bacterium]|jgi:DNA-directed RNA polymerase subunit beta'|nr:DNA-directed RNA polymerase subunit beta' [Patescibacteria group bacterium]